MGVVHEGAKVVHNYEVRHLLEESKAREVPLQVLCAPGAYKGSTTGACGLESLVLPKCTPAPGPLRFGRVRRAKGAERCALCSPGPLAGRSFFAPQVSRYLMSTRR